MPQNPFAKSKLTRCYKTKTKKRKNYSKTKKTFFLPSTKDDQLKSDHRVEMMEYGFYLVAGGATITGG
jgi:hypothetical protein